MLVMELITRKHAKAEGLRRYFTGVRCKNGHLSWRFTNSTACIACNRHWSAQWIKSHAPENQANGRRYRSTKRGYLSEKFKNMRYRVAGSFERCAHLYKGLGIMSRDEFLAWALTDPTFNALWDAWQLAGRPRALSPSIDRIDTQRGYVRGNVQFLTHGQNSKKAGLWQHHGINPITKAA